MVTWKREVKKNQHYKLDYDVLDFLHASDLISLSLSSQLFIRNFRKLSLLTGRAILFFDFFFVPFQATNHERAERWPDNAKVQSQKMWNDRIKNKHDCELWWIWSALWLWLSVISALILFFSLMQRNELHLNGEVGGKVKVLPRIWRVSRLKSGRIGECLEAAKQHERLKVIIYKKIIRTHWRVSRARPFSCSICAASHVSGSFSGG